MTAPFRVKRGALIDEQQPLRFTFDGRTYDGYSGDTLASALLSHGVHLVGRSFKYHRPRGVMSAGPEEANALVGIDRGQGRFEPNTRATMQEVYDGLRASSQNRWPSLAFDLGSLFDLGSRFLPAGFYYKTFMWPRWGWKHLYEPAIRATAGLGAAPRAADPDRYANQYAHCDILIIGAGGAGLSAALTAAAAGAKVILCDERARMGGSLLTGSEAIDGTPAQQWAANALHRLGQAENVTLLPRTTAFGYYAHNFVCLAERVTDHLSAPSSDAPRERIWQVRARHVILATGAIERPMLFSNNDRPGIMLAGAGRTYLNQYGVAVGKNVVISTNNDSAYAAAKDLAEAGVKVAALTDFRANPPQHLVAELRALNVTVLGGASPLRADGGHRVRAVDIVERDTGSTHRIKCDALLTSAGWTPTVHLFSQSGGKLEWNEKLQAFIPAVAIQSVSCAGACRGIFNAADVVADGTTKAGAALADLGLALPAPGQAAPQKEFAIFPRVEHPSPDQGKSFIDFQNDVTIKDIKLATREGFTSVEHLKRYTTTGMATDQGKTSNLHALSIAAREQDRTPPEVGLTTFRPPYTPVTFGAIANVARDLELDPVRRTPIHEWAERQGAVFEDVGLWKRARHFPRGRETMHDAVARECRATRESAGIFDASTLGKIEVVGPDAAEFMNRMYTNPWSKLAVGACRYGLMLREDGFIFDDGVVGRLAENRFHVTTTTSGAPRVLAHMENYLQTEFPDLRVWLTSTTEQWAVIALNGPNSRKIIEPLVEDIDLDKDSFPHMSVRIGRILGVPTRLFRISFTGELGFEINVPANYALSIWSAIHEAGREFGLTPYGTETMHVLRAEKGYIIVGQDTDGTVTPADAGMSWAVGAKKKDFVGKRSLRRPDMVAPGRKQLVGLTTQHPRELLPEGAQLVDPNGDPARSIGHVTSSYWSAALNRSIALGLIEDGQSRQGQTLRVPTHGGATAVQVAEPLFYDPKGERLHV